MVVFESGVEPQLGHVDIHIKVRSDLVDGIDFLNPDL